MNVKTLLCRCVFAGGLLFLFSSATVLATPVPSSSLADGSGLVLMIDGKDRGSSVTVDFGLAGRNKSGLQFGFLLGELFNPLRACHCGRGSATFAGGTTVDFAARSKGTDGRFGTLDDQIFPLSDGTLFVSEYFSHPIKASNSRNPMVTDRYYGNLMLVWDINRDGIKDLTVMLHARNAHDGMRGVPPPTPVPLPAAVWLLGSGLAGLVGVARSSHRKNMT